MLCRGDRRHFWLSRDGRPDAFACVLPSVARPHAAAATWRLVVANAPWAARGYHTTVIDAAGAIYVIGGWSGRGIDYYNDVWASTNGGAGRARGYSRGTQRPLEDYYAGTQGYSSTLVLERHARCSQVALTAGSRETLRQRYSRGTIGDFEVRGYSKTGSPKRARTTTRTHMHAGPKILGLSISLSLTHSVG